METPYEYFDNKLGVRLSYIIADRNPHKNSLKLINYPTLRYRINSANHTERELRRGCLNSDALILFSSLSRDFKDAITTAFGKPKEQIKQSFFASHYIADGKAREFYLAHRYGKKEEKKLDLKLVDLYTYNASVLNAVMACKTNRKAYAKALGGVKINMWQSLSNDVNAFREVPHDLPTTPDGLRFKVDKYKKGSYEAIITRKLQNANAKKTIMEEQNALLDELLAKHTNLDNQIIKTLYNVVAEKMGWKSITAQTVANHKKGSNLVTYAGRNGVKALKNNLLMQVKRKGPSAPMLYWTMDGWDAELLYQQTFVDKDGYKKTTYHNRLTLVLILDPYNYYPVGYAIGTHETPELIQQALQNAMRHTMELFGDFQMPYQLQSDNYAVKKLRPIYEAVTNHFTPAEVGNAKSKVIEPYFGRINKKYCKLLDNWSGHNTVSGSKNQPNSEYLNKIKKQFPDKLGCIKQLEAIVAQERREKSKEYTDNWDNTRPEYRKTMSAESYLLTFGSCTGYTSKLRGDGLRTTIDGQKYWFDSFDINFRHQAHQDWLIRYDVNDLSHVLAVSKDGSERFMLEQKYLQPMALADRQEGDTYQMKRINDFKKENIEMIINQRANNTEVLMEFFDLNQLDDTLAKHLLSDSLGQHKNHKSAHRLEAVGNATKLVEKTAKKEEKKQAKTFADEQAEYYASKVNINEYI